MQRAAVSRDSGIPKSNFPHPCLSSRLGMVASPFLLSLPRSARFRSIPSCVVLTQGLLLSINPKGSCGVIESWPLGRSQRSGFQNTSLSGRHWILLFVWKEAILPGRKTRAFLGCLSYSLEGSPVLLAIPLSRERDERSLPSPFLLCCCCFRDVCVTLSKIHK